MPINRVSVGLHAWGSVVPAFKECNDVKKGHAWVDHPRTAGSNRRYILDYGHAPDLTELQVVLEKLYGMAKRRHGRSSNSASWHHAPTSRGFTRHHPW